MRTFLQNLGLALVVLLGIATPRASAAPCQPAYEFKAGTYECRQNGLVTWSLTLTPDPKSPTRYVVSGTWGGIMTSQVGGMYDAASNVLRAGSIKPKIDILGIESPIPLVDIDGAFMPGSGTLFVQPKIYKQGVNLKFVSALPPPSPPGVVVEGCAVEPLVAGQPIGGTARLKFDHVVNSTQGWVAIALRTHEGVATGRLPISVFPETPEMVIDLSSLCVTVPVATPTADVEIAAGLGGAFGAPGHCTAHFEKVQQSDRPVFVTKFSGKLDGATPSGESPQAAVIEFTLGTKVEYTLGGRSTTFDATVRSTCIVEGEDSGETRILWATEKEVQVSGTNPRTIGPTQIDFPQDLRKGFYKLTFSVDGDRVRPYVWTSRFYTDGNGILQSPPPPDPVDIDATVSLSKSVLKKPNDTMTVEIKYGYTKGPESVDIEETVEVKPDAGGGKVRTKKKIVHLTRGERRVTSLTVRATPNTTPGAYRATLGLSGLKIQNLSQDRPFTVEDPAAQAPSTPTPSGPPSGPLGANTPTGKGTFGLVKKEIGKATGPDSGPYGTWSGSQGENSFSASYQMKPPYDGQFSINMSWGAPPAVIRPGDTIELTCTASATASGKDLGSPGGSACWGVGGGAEVIENACAFAGVSGSTGKLIPSSSGKTKIKVPRGGEFTLYSSHPGVNWGSGGVWNPCVYTYKFDAAPTVDPGPAPAAQPAQPASDPSPPADPNDDGLTLTNSDPKDDEPEARLSARLDVDHITVRAGGMSESVHVIISNFRGNTSDRVEVIFPKLVDEWGSPRGPIVAGGGNGSFDPSNMDRPEHSAGWFMSARSGARAGSYPVEIIVRQNKAGQLTLKLTVNVLAAFKPPAPDPSQPPMPPGATPPPPGTPPSAPPLDFSGPWITTYGPMTLAQRGLRVEGTFSTGTITGTVQGDTLTFKFDEHDVSPAIGYGKFRMDPDGLGFQGGWTYSDRIDEPLRVWNGRRGVGPVAGALPGGMDPPEARPGRPGSERTPTPDGRRPSPGGNTPAGQGTPAPQPGVPVHQPAGQGNPVPVPPGGAEPTRPGGTTPPGIVPTDTAHGRPGAAATGSGPWKLTDGRLDPRLWSSEGEKGAAATVQGDRIALDVPLSSDGEVQSFGATAIEGSFDITIDYTLVDWKPGAAATLQWTIYVGDTPDPAAKNLVQVAMIARDNRSDVLVARTNGKDPIDQPASGKTEGKLRVSRNHDQWAVFQWTGSGWQTIERFEFAMPKSVFFGVGLERNGPVGARALLRPRDSDGR